MISRKNSLDGKIQSIPHYVLVILYTKEKTVMMKWKTLSLKIWTISKKNGLCWGRKKIRLWSRGMLLSCNKRLASRPWRGKRSNTVKDLKFASQPMFVKHLRFVCQTFEICLLNIVCQTFEISLSNIFCKNLRLASIKHFYLLQTLSESIAKDIIRNQPSAT